MPDQGFVYLIGPVPGDPGLVKIGKTIDLTRRLGEVQVLSPVRAMIRMVQLGYLEPTDNPGGPPYRVLDMTPVDLSGGVPSP